MKNLPKIAVLAFGAFVVASPAQQAFADGKSAFVDAKCVTCHSIKNLGVEKTKKKKGPDLSGVGIEHDDAWIIKFLNKEIDKKSAYSDKKVKHKKKFKGSEADLKTIATFLAAQKTKVDVKDEGGADEADDDKE